MRNWFFQQFLDRLKSEILDEHLKRHNNRDNNSGDKMQANNGTHPTTEMSINFRLETLGSLGVQYDYIGWHVSMRVCVPMLCGVCMCVCVCVNARVS